MRVKVDRSRCCGVGLCEITAPNVFEVGADGQSHVLIENPPPEEWPAVEEAVANCPNSALLIED